MKATELKAALRKGLVKFTFKKVDGSIREAFGTRNMKYVPTENHPKGTGVEVDSVVKFYDLDKQAWRSVSVKAEIEIHEILTPESSVAGITITPAAVGIATVEIPTPKPVDTFTAKVAAAREGIDFSKNGAITEKLFRFCEGGATYTELNMFYLCKTPATYDSKRDRGGSLTKHMISMQDAKRRAYSGRVKYIVKEDGKWITVNC